MSVVGGVVVMVAVGALLAPQAPLNGGLAAATGRLPATALNFLVGLVCVFAACAVAGQLGDVWGVWDVPVTHSLGALLGISYVLVALSSVGAIGASGVVAATVAGWLISSLALDQGGALGLERKPLTLAVALGAVAVFVGVYMVVGGGGASSRHASESAWRRFGPVVLVVVGGAAVGVQHPLNGYLGGSIGDLPAALVNFGLGAAVLLVLLAIRGEVRELAGIARVPWGYRLGGVIGAINATLALTLVDTIGAGALTAATVTGLAIASLGLDRFGVLGLAPRPLTARRVGGALLVVGGTILVALT